MDDYRAEIPSVRRPLMPRSNLARISEIYDRLELGNGSWDSVRAAAGKLGSALAPNAFLAELNPIVRSAYYSLGRYWDGEWRAHGFLRSDRARLFAEAIRTYRPRLVIMYGSTGKRYWNIASGFKLSAIRLNNRWGIAAGSANGTLFVATPSPHFFDSEAINEVLRQIALEIPVSLVDRSDRHPIDDTYWEINHKKGSKQ